MSLQNDVGQHAYDGPREFVASDPTRSLRHVVLYDESEGAARLVSRLRRTELRDPDANGDTVELAHDFAPGT